MCGRRFARISDLRSHERIHSTDARRYECKHCGKRFTRPYDLKKHEMNIHRQESLASGKKKKESRVFAYTLPSGGGAGDGTARNGGSKRPRISGVEISGAIPRKNEQAGAAHSSQPLPIKASAAASGLVATPQEQLQEQHNQQWRSQYQAWQSNQQLLDHQRQRHPENPGSLADSSLLKVGQGHPPPPLRLPSQPPPLLPPQGPAIAKAAAAPHRHLRRMRVRCHAHKHCEPAAAPERVNSQGRANVINVPGGPAASGPMLQHGDDRRQEPKTTETLAEAKAHVHGAACGHVAVLHENHVDFLMADGQLECFDGKEVRLCRVYRAVLCFVSLHNESTTCRSCSIELLTFKVAGCGSRGC